MGSGQKAVTSSTNGEGRRWPQGLGLSHRTLKNGGSAGGIKPPAPSKRHRQHGQHGQGRDQTILAGAQRGRAKKLFIQGAWLKQILSSKPNAYPSSRAGA